MSLRVVHVLTLTVAIAASVIVGALAYTLLSSQVDTPETASYPTGTIIDVAIYRGGAACSGCPEAVATMLRSDTTYDYRVRYVGENEPQKLTSQSLESADLYIQPGGGLVREDWPKLGITGQAAVRDYVNSGGRMLGICLGAFFFDRYGDAGWGWLSGIDTYRGELLSEGRLAPTTWGDEQRLVYWEGGQYFSEAHHRTEVLARYANQQPVAILHHLPDGGILGGIGVHTEADQSWYRTDAQYTADRDGSDADLGISVVHAILQATPDIAN